MGARTYDVAARIAIHVHNPVPVPFVPSAPRCAYYSDLGNVLVAGGGGYWVTTSDIRTGQTAYPAPGSSSTSIKILRVLRCDG